MENVIEFLHVAPLFVIGLLLFAPKVLHILLQKKIVIPSINSIVLVLSSIGIAAGTNAHHAFEHLIDPCFGYSAILIVMALKISAMKRSVTQS